MKWGQWLLIIYLTQLLFEIRVPFKWQCKIIKYGKIGRWEVLLPIRINAALLTAFYAIRGQTLYNCQINNIF